MFLDAEIELYIICIIGGFQGSGRGPAWGLFAVTWGLLA